MGGAGGCHAPGCEVQYSMRRGVGISTLRLAFPGKSLLWSRSRKSFLSRQEDVCTFRSHAARTGGGSFAFEVKYVRADAVVFYLIAVRHLPNSALSERILNPVVEIVVLRSTYDP